MTGLAVYSSDYGPQRLYSRGDAVAVDTALVENVVRYGDRPLDMYVDLADRRLLWSFKAERHTKSTRTGYFVAAYQDDDDLYRGFEAELRRLHDTDEWTVPYTGETRWDVGFDLWRIPADVPEPGYDAFQRLRDRLRNRQSEETLVFGMRSRRSALQVVKALDEQGIECTIAIGEDVQGRAPVGADLLLVPGSDQDFEPRSREADSLVDADPHNASDGGTTQSPSSPRTATGSFLSRLAGGLVLVCLGFAAYSFISPTPVRPITGLATVGGLLGAMAGLTSRELFLSDDRRDLTEATRTALLSHPDQSLVVLAYGTVAGFGFPRIAWEAGSFAGRGGFPFGSISSVVGAVPTVALYAVVLFGASTGLVAGHRHMNGHDGLTVDDLKTSAVGHLAYGLCLAVATGFAGGLWFIFVPAAGG